MRKYQYLVVLLLSFSGCSHKEAKVRKNNHSRVKFEEEIARLSSIPDAPLHVTLQKVIRSERDPDNVQVRYKIGSSVIREDVKDFYLSEMERIGWMLQLEWLEGEYVLQFMKPRGQMCLITIRENKTLLITLAKKKDAS